jgi:protein-disulfide isomerase
MVLSQVNLAAALCFLALAIACAPAGTGSRGTDSTTVAPTQAAPSTASVPAVQDSNITLADLARIEGSAAAPVWVIVVSDFQCPYCKQWHDTTYPTLHNEFVKTGKVRVAYVNYPLNSHAHAWPSAEAAMCAGAQGKFWEMHDAVFDSQARWAAAAAPATVFDSLARKTGVDMARWKRCVDSGVTKPLIRADQQRASSAGVRSTPTFLIGDEMLTGAHPIASFRRAIDSALVKTAKTAR